MCQFIETMRIINGHVLHLDVHHARANAARREVLNLHETIDFSGVIPRDIAPGVYKCRVIFGAEITGVHIERYAPRRISSLALIDGGDIDYAYKYADRTAIEALYAQRGTCDDILIIKDGLITDTSYANIVLSDGHRWYTPDAPLLAGTMRQRLLEKGMIREVQIRVQDLPHFRKFVLVNAMRGFHTGSARSVTEIINIK
jgi:4-amino-4-deoxychorismate lyase